MRFREAWARGAGRPRFGGRNLMYLIGAPVGKAFVNTSAPKIKRARKQPRAFARTSQRVQGAGLPGATLPRGGAPAKQNGKEALVRDGYLQRPCASVRTDGSRRAPA